MTYEERKERTQILTNILFLVAGKIRSVSPEGSSAISKIICHVLMHSIDQPPLPSLDPKESEVFLRLVDGNLNYTQAHELLGLPMITNQFGALTDPLWPVNPQAPTDCKV